MTAKYRVVYEPQCRAYCVERKTWFFWRRLNFNIAGDMIWGEASDIYTIYAPREYVFIEFCAKDRQTAFLKMHEAKSLDKRLKLKPIVVSARDNIEYI